MGADDEAEVEQPECAGEDDGGEDGWRGAADGVAGAGPEHPEDGRREEDGGGLGEDHERQKDADEEGGTEPDGDGVVWTGPEGGGGEERQQAEQQQQRLKDRHAAEGVEEGIGGEEGEQAGGSERWGATVRARRAPCLHGELGEGSADKKREDERRKAEEADGEGARGDDADAGELEDETEEDGPDGQGDGRVEVAGDVPVASLKVADGGVAVPALIGVLGPVHPWGVGGEVGG